MRPLLLLLLIISTLYGYGQKLAENKIDDFTKHAIKRTSWETICKSSQFYGYCRVSKIDSAYWLDVKVFTHGVAAIAKGAELMLMTTKDSVISLVNWEYRLSCNGCGSVGLLGSSAQGVNLQFILSSDGIETLRSNPIKKIRLYTTDGYMEGELKDKFQDILLKELALVN